MDELTQTIVEGPSPERNDFFMQGILGVVTLVPNGQQGRFGRSGFGFFSATCLGSQELEISKKR